MSRLPADREAWKVWGGVAVLVAAGFALAYSWVGPPPERELVLATGTETGSYHAIGERYAAVLARSGVEVRLLPTAGAVENLAALRSGQADVALVQGGTAPADVADFAKGIASVFFEPLWVFHRAELDVARLADLGGRRIEIGAAGSGTRAVATELLAASGIGPADATFGGAPAGAAIAALLAGEADAVLLVTAPGAEVVARAMAEVGGALALLDVDRHLAWVRRHPYLAHVVLGEGVLDLQSNRPARDVDMLAPTAVLMARADLHAALVPLFIQAAEEVHGGGDLLAEPGRFPSQHNLGAPLAGAAREYFRNGPSFLYRVLPFPVAATLDRLKILLLPFLTLLVPLVRLAPPIYRWRIRRKIFLWYRHLERIERHATADPAEREAALARLDAIEREIVADVDVPASYMEELHNLRMHVERARTRLASE